MDDYTPFDVLMRAQNLIGFQKKRRVKTTVRLESANRHALNRIN
ncbi:hypothetical protein ACMXZU_03390 [Corynebacterium striatum]